MKHAYLPALLILLLVSIVFLTTSCASKEKKKVIMLNCERTNTQVPRGLLDLCDIY